jgi:hypothetical protein
MKVDSYGFALWAIGIVAGGVALIMYQHGTHTDFILNALSGGSVPVDPNIGLPPTAVSGPIAQSQFTGVWTPIGPSPIGPYNTTPNPNYPNPQTYPDYFSILTDPSQYLGQEFVMPGTPQIGNTYAN